VPFGLPRYPVCVADTAAAGEINGRGGPGRRATLNLRNEAASYARASSKIQGVEATWGSRAARLWNPLDGFGYRSTYTHVKQDSRGSGLPEQAFGVSPNTYKPPSTSRSTTTRFGSRRMAWRPQIKRGFNQQGIPLAEIFTMRTGRWTCRRAKRLRLSDGRGNHREFHSNITDEKQEGDAAGFQRTLNKPPPLVWTIPVQICWASTGSSD